MEFEDLTERLRNQNKMCTLAASYLRAVVFPSSVTMVKRTGVQRPETVGDSNHGVSVSQQARPSQMSKAKTRTCVDQPGVKRLSWLLQHSCFKMSAEDAVDINSDNQEQA